jgi:AcrR family transcriptional regulator
VSSLDGCTKTIRETARIAKSRSGRVARTNPLTCLNTASVPKIVDHDARRRELAQAASKVIVRQGLDGVTVREIAREAGFSAGSLGHYFPSKDDVLIAVLDEAMADTVARMLRRTEVHRGVKLARDLVAELMPLDARRTLENKVWIIYSAQAITSQKLRKAYLRNELLIQAQLSFALRQAIEDGELGDLLDADLEASRLLALSDGIAQQALFDKRMWTAEQQLAAIDEHLDALRTRGETMARRAQSGHELRQ